LKGKELIIHKMQYTLIDYHELPKSTMTRIFEDIKI